GGCAPGGARQGDTLTAGYCEPAGSCHCSPLFMKRPPERPGMVWKRSYLSPDTSAQRPVSGRLRLDPGVAPEGVRPGQDCSAGGAGEERSLRFPGRELVQLASALGSVAGADALAAVQGLRRRSWSRAVERELVALQAMQAP